MLLDFNEIERSVYDIVKARFITRINTFSKTGELDKQYGYALQSSTCATGVANNMT
jgi:hypothetical protein